MHLSANGMHPCVINNNQSSSQEIFKFNSWMSFQRVSFSVGYESALRETLSHLVLLYAGDVRRTAALFIFAVY